MKGTCTMDVSQMNYYIYFPYIIYFLSPVYIEREITIKMIHKSRIQPEQLIGVVCGSTSVFFLILGIIILAWKKRNEVTALFCMVLPKYRPMTCSIVLAFLFFCDYSIFQ